MKAIGLLILLFIRPAFGMSDLSSMAGIGAGLSSMFGQGSQNPYSAPSFYQPTGQGGADTNWQQMLGQQMGAQQAINPALLQSFQQTMGAAPQLSGMYAGLSGQQQNAGQGMMGAGNQILNTAFDPQQALFNQQQQLVQDQSRAASAASGLSMSPYAAGQEQNAMQNFDINWQNAQLGRQQSGAQSAGQAYGQGLNYMGQAPQSLMQGYQVPAQAGMQYGQQLQGLDQNTMSQILQYLGQGTSAAGSQAGAYNTGQQNAQMQGGAGMSALLSGLGGAGGALGNFSLGNMGAALGPGGGAGALGFLAMG